MIQHFSLKNFLSFKETATLSFEATRDDNLDHCQVVEVAPGVRLLRLALIYGANAGGKSNLLAALRFVRNFWFERKADLGEQTGVIPFMLHPDTPREPSTFELTFYVGATKYAYSLTLDPQRVHSERLHCYKSVQPTLLFDRGWKDGRSVIRLNPDTVRASHTVVEEINLKCLPNMSFFAARNQVNCSLPLVDPARDWMHAAFLPPVTPDTQMLPYAESRMQADGDVRRYVLDFLHRADFNITGISARQPSTPRPASLRETLLHAYPPPISDATTHPAQTDFEHTVSTPRGTESYTLPDRLQSAGTRRILGLEAAIYDALRNQRILPIDEIEASLHPELVEYVLEQFLRTHSRSQLIATTHYDPLLNTIDDLLRKDTVWFAEKGADGASELTALVEYKGLGKVRSFCKSYRNGAFGALPQLKA